MRTIKTGLLLSSFLLSLQLLSQENIPVNGVFPQNTVISGHKGRTEAGIGAMINWADRLWVVGYVAHIIGSGPGLYSLKEDMVMKKHPKSYTGTYANRLIHEHSLQALIGPYLIDTLGNVKILEDLKKHRLAATMQHLFHQDSMVYYLTMEGLFFETNVYTRKSKLLYNLVKELDIPTSAQVHFKSGYTQAGKVYVANNSYYEEDYNGTRAAGRLAEWDGKRWTVLDKNPYVEVSGKNWHAGSYGDAVYATGWDRASVLLKFNRNGKWKTYRLPKASYAYDHAWNTEWMRIREANTERYLMDIHGIFYELPTITYNDNIMGIRPISCHLRMVPDFISWRGMLVLGSDQADNSSGQPQSGLWFGNMDDLWSYGKPKGFGGVWYESDVAAGTVSDPFLMNGFDQKTMHISHQSDHQVTIDVEIDFLGNNTWVPYKTFTVGPHGYVHHEFPQGFSAHWVRCTVREAAAKLNVFFMYN